MQKSLHTDGHRRLAALLRRIREEAGLRQLDVAQALDEPQSFVAKYETGERRLDLVELTQIAEALGTTIEAVVVRWRSPDA